MCGIFLTYFFILARKSAEPEEDIKAMCSQGNGVLRSRELRLLLAHIGKRRNFDLRDVLYVVLCAVQCAVQQNAFGGGGWLSTSGIWFHCMHPHQSPCPSLIIKYSADSLVLLLGVLEME